jgi:hypothetical protein
MSPLSTCFRKLLRQAFVWLRKSLDEARQQERWGVSDHHLTTPQVRLDRMRGCGNLAFVYAERAAEYWQAAQDVRAAKRELRDWAEVLTFVSPRLHRLAGAGRVATGKGRLKR